MGHGVFDHGAERQRPLSTRGAVLIVVACASLGALLWKQRGPGVSAGYTRSTRGAPVPDARDLGALMVASKTGDYSAVEALLNRGIDPNVLDDQGRSALSMALRSGELATARRLLSAGAKPSRDIRHETPDLHVAATYDDGELIGLLIAAGARVDQQLADQEGATALHVASENGRAQTCSALILARAFLDVQDAKGLTPLSRAAILGRSAVVRMLCERGADGRIPDARGRRALHFSAASGDLESVRALLDVGSDPRAADDRGWTALHVACAHGRADAVLALIGVLDRAALDGRTSRGATALHFAARRADARCVSALLDAGADPSLRDDRGRTARDFGPREGIGIPWTRLGPMTAAPAPRRPEPALLDAAERRPALLLMTRPARAFRGPRMLLELALWDDGVVVYAPWSADGSREYLAGVIPVAAVDDLLLDLEELDWLESEPPAADPLRHDCAELMLERRGSWKRVLWEQLERPRFDPAPLSRAASADWERGRTMASDVLRAALPQTATTMDFLLVRGQFRGLRFQDGARAAWME